MDVVDRSSLVFKRAIQVLKSHKKLLLFPLIISVFSWFIFLFFLVPIGLWESEYALTDMKFWEAVATAWLPTSAESDVHLSSVTYFLLASLYMVSMFMSTFFNVAFYNEIMNALNGRPVSIRGGLRLALSRLKSIFLWSLCTGIVGLILQSLEQRAGFVGRWILKFIGISWSVASVFVIPVIIREDKQSSPVRLLRTSAVMLKRSWGESIVGYVGLRCGAGIATCIFVVAILCSMFLADLMDDRWMYYGGMGLSFVSILTFFYIVGVVSSVYRVALYIYASEGVVPAAFDRDDMDMAWKVKSGQKARG